MFRRLFIGVAISTIAFSSNAQNGSLPQSPTWTTPDIDALAHDRHGTLVRQGRVLMTATYAHIGPDASDPAKRYAGNNLACTNCHLHAGTKKFGIPLFGIIDEFPKYSARTGNEISIEDRLNSCMTRSMNGRPLPSDSDEMRALVAYVGFLSTGVLPGQALEGMGTGKMPELARAADPARGEMVYARACTACHNADGSGVQRSRGNPALGYLTPPLWGNDSFNDGAGMARLINFANFVHFNMPHGADYLNPQLTLDDSWDVAAYVLSQARPSKADLDRDFPDLLEKPIDAPYGPYADTFPALQHKYGPFQPIREALMRLRAQSPQRTK